MAFIFGFSFRRRQRRIERRVDDLLTSEEATRLFAVHLAALSSDSTFNVQNQEPVFATVGNKFNASSTFRPKASSSRSNEESPRCLQNANPENSSSNETPSTVQEVPMKPIPTGNGKPEGLSTSAFPKLNGRPKMSGLAPFRFQPKASAFGPFPKKKS